MSAYPSNSESVAQDQIKAFVERILRMREEAKAINDDIREIYAEAKGNGFGSGFVGRTMWRAPCPPATTRTVRRS